MEIIGLDNWDTYWEGSPCNPGNIKIYLYYSTNMSWVIDFNNMDHPENFGDPEIVADVEYKEIKE